MRDITDFIGQLKEEFPEELAGTSSMGGFDGPPLDTTRQYRVVVQRAEWRQANSGNWSYAITFEVTEDIHDEFVGRKFSEYYSIEKGGSSISAEKFSKLIGESGIPLDEFDQSSNEAFAKGFEGAEFVVATRVWGEDGDRTGLRYLNRDRGQALLDNIKAPAERGGSKKPLKADINVNKEKGPQEEAAAEGEPAQETEQAAPPVNLPGSGSAAPVNLPPGLARN